MLYKPLSYDTLHMGKKYSKLKVFLSKLTMQRSDRHPCHLRCAPGIWITKRISDCSVCWTSPCPLCWSCPWLSDWQSLSSRSGCPRKRRTATSFLEIFSQLYLRRMKMSEESFRQVCGCLPCEFQNWWCFLSFL